MIQHIPEFRMYDPYVTGAFTIRALLTHLSKLSLGAGTLCSFPMPAVLHARKLLKERFLDFKSIDKIVSETVEKGVTGKVLYIN